MKTPHGGHADFKPSVQLAFGIVNVGIPPGDDRTALDHSFRQAFSVQIAQRRYNRGERVERSADDARTKWFGRMRVPMRRLQIGRYRVQTLGIPGQVDEPIFVSDNLAK